MNKKFAVSLSASFRLRIVIASVLCALSCLFALLSLGEISQSLLSFGGTDVNLITGGEVSPHVAQATSAVWGHANTVVSAYDDTSGAGVSPVSYCGVSASTDGGVTFTREPEKFNTGGACYGDPAVVYSVRAAKWFTTFLAGRCGGAGIGVWTSPNGLSWTTGSCAATTGQADVNSLWVDNNPASPFYGRQYTLYNDFNVGGGAVQLTRSTDDGLTWSSATTIYASFRRAWKVTGSLGADGTIFAQTLEENGGGLATPRQNFIHRSTDGGLTWSAPIAQGGTFAGPGRSVSGYFAGMYSTPVAGYWHEMGWGEPAVGPASVVHYAYCGAGTGGDPGDILYVRSTDNGFTWSTPLKLNTDATARAQWGPSLSVNRQGNVFVSWYDERNTTTDSLERYGRSSLDNGATWGSEMAVSDVVFPKPLQTDASVQNTYVGIYHRSAFSNDGTGSVAYHTWTDGRVAIGGSPQEDVFFDRVPFTTCAFFSENFDGVTAPALPSGWVATNAQGPAPAWTTSTTTADSVPNDAFVDNPPAISDKRLETPPIAITTSGVQVSFRNSYNLESTFDGAVLEVSSPNVNAGAFTDITNAAIGGSFVIGGYNGGLNASFGNPLGGRSAWTGNSGGYITTLANLGPNVVGQTIKLRFRMGSDSSVGATGWRIDSVALTSSNCPPALLTAVSRKSHVGAGNFDVSLPLSGTLGVESRKGLGVNSDIHQVIATFASPVSVGGVTVTSSDGMATASSSVSGTTVTITVSSVANAQKLGISLNGVNDGTTMGSLNIPMGVLLGDANGDRNVNSADATITRNHSGQPTDASNFRTDYNVDGNINSADATAVRARSGNFIP